MKKFMCLSLCVVLSALSLFGETIEEMAERIRKIPATGGKRFGVIKKLNLSAEDEKEFRARMYQLDKADAAPAKSTPSSSKKTESKPANKAPAAKAPAGAVIYQEVIKKATDVPVDIFTVTDDVQVENPPRFGANFNGSISPKPWFDGSMLNAWNERRTMEPVVMKEVFLVQEMDDTGEGNTLSRINKYFLRKSKKHGQDYNREGLSKYLKYDISVWEGADIYLYKRIDDRHHEVHKAKVKEVGSEDIQERAKMRGGKVVNYDRREWLTFDPPMPKDIGPLEPGDVFILQDKEADLRSRIQSPDGRFKKHANGFFAAIEGAVDVIDLSQKCPEDSTASMKVELPGGTAAGMSQAFLSQEPVKRGWLELSKGAPYKCQVWLKQAGMPNGDVTIDIAGMVTETVKVTDQWQKFELDIPADSQSKVTDQIGKLSITSTEKGTLWIDNFLVWQIDTPKFFFNPQYIKALKDYKPGHLRYWGEFASSMDAVLNHGWSAPDKWTIGRRVDGNNGFSLHVFLSSCMEVGADPWIILRAEQTDEDLQHFMEYLGAPATVGYGALRASHGQKEPWTGVFKDILVECHNEAWGTGYGPYHNEPSIYAGMANRMFHIVRQSPYYDEDQFMTIANGWSGHEAWQRHYKTGEFQKDIPGWSMRMALEATGADGIDAAYYIGGADGLTVLGVDDTDFYGKQLMYGPRVVEARLDNFSYLHEETARVHRGKTYTMLMYEGGPGYPTPSAQKPFTPTGEQVGKSLALGITTLDAYMVAQAAGFHSQCYFGFQRGNNFSSHHSHNSLHPWPSWTVLQMRNNYCSGDLMKVEETKLKRVDFPAETVSKMSYDNKREVKRTVNAKDDISFSKCYAFQDGKKHSFILFNRHYNEPREVELRLPYNPKSEVKIYYLSEADPRTSNRDEYLVKMKQETRNDCSKKYRFVLQPSSAYVLVNEEK